MATKDIMNYFKHEKPSTLPSSILIRLIGNYRLLAKVMVPIKITAKGQAVIGECATKNGIAVVIHHFRNGWFPNL